MFAIPIYFLVAKFGNYSVLEDPVLSQSKINVFKWLIAALTIALIIQYLISKIRNASVVINKNGICDQYTFSRLGLISWAEIANVEISKGPLGGGIIVTLRRNRQIGIQVSDRLCFRGLNLSPDTIHSVNNYICLLYTSPSPRDQRGSRMPSSA